MSRLAAAADRWIFDSFAGQRLDLAVFRIVYASWMLLAWVPRSLDIRGTPDVFFSPPLGPAALLDGFPADVWFELLSVALVAALVCLLFGCWTRAAAIAVGLLQLGSDAWAYATGTITHTILVALVPLVLAFSGWGDAVSVDAGRGRGAVPPGRNTWLLALLALLVGLAFFSAGFAKLNAGWLDPDTHATYGYMVGRFFTKARGTTWLAERSIALDSALAWEALDWLAVGFELSFPLFVVSRRSFQIYCALACLFHLGVRLLLGINFEQNLIAYAAFVRWSELPWPRAIRDAARSLATRLADAPPVGVAGAALALGAFAVYGLGQPPLHLLADGRDGASLPTLVLAVAGALWFLARVLWPAPRVLSVGAAHPMQPVLLFDGVCGLCDRIVDFALRQDRRGRLRFAPLQSEPGRALLAAAGLDPDALDAVVLVRNGRAYRESAAALRVLAELGLPWSLLAAGLVVPAPLRDAVYRLVARNRYAWFGRRETCRVATPEERARFLA